MKRFAHFLLAALLCLLTLNDPGSCQQGRCYMFCSKYVDLIIIPIGESPRAIFLRMRANALALTGTNASALYQACFFNHAPSYDVVLWKILLWLGESFAFPVFIQYIYANTVYKYNFCVQRVRTACCDRMFIFILRAQRIVIRHVKMTILGPLARTMYALYIR